MTEETPKARRAERLPKLTDAQIETLVYIADYCDRDPCRRSPTYRVLAAGLGISMTSAFERVDRLRDAGVVSGGPNAFGANEPNEIGLRIVARVRMMDAE